MFFPDLNVTLENLQREVYPEDEKLNDGDGDGDGDGDDGGHEHGQGRDRDRDRDVMMHATTSDTVDKEEGLEAGEYHPNKTETEFGSSRIQNTIADDDLDQSLELDAESSDMFAKVLSTSSSTSPPSENIE